MDIEQWTQNIINATASFWNKIAAFLPNLVATIVILVAREDMRGRSLGVMSLAIGASPLGALLVGGLANTLGPTQAITIMGVLVSGYAIFQHYGQDFLNLTEPTGGGRGRAWCFE